MKIVSLILGLLLEVISVIVLVVFKDNSLVTLGIGAVTIVCGIVGLMLLSRTFWSGTNGIGYLLILATLMVGFLTLGFGLNGWLSRHEDEQPLRSGA